MERKIRVLVGKPGLDGHDRGAKVVAAALRDSGMEVIYTGLHQTPEQIVEAALQEDVDVVALSILSGAHMTLFPDVLELMKDRGLGERLLTGGGIIPPEDMDSLSTMGVGKLFGPGSSTQDIAVYIRDWFVRQHGDSGLAPLRLATESTRPRMPASAPAIRAKSATVKPRKAAMARAAAPRRKAVKAARAKLRKAKPKKARSAKPRSKVSRIKGKSSSARKKRPRAKTAARRARTRRPARKRR